MKYQLLLWSLIAIIFGLESLDRHSTQAKPASIFHPIIEDIRTHIPSSLQIRLPAVLPTLAEDTTLYSFVPEGDLNMISMGKEDLDTFMVLVSKIPHCQTQENVEACLAGQQA